MEVWIYIKFKYIVGESIEHLIFIGHSLAVLRVCYRPASWDKLEQEIGYINNLTNQVSIVHVTQNTFFMATLLPSCGPFIQTCELEKLEQDLPLGTWIIQ